jgi:uncharacterized protein (DUF305 family)
MSHDAPGTPVTELRRGPLRTVLLAVIGIALLVLGGGLAVGLGIGRDDPPASDSVDAGFARDMSRHHVQAVEMANLVPERSADATVRQLAFDIGETQNNQVGRMQGWLALWGLPQSGGAPMAWMGSDAHAGHDMAGMDLSGSGLMPGMATEDELSNLRELTGTEFDVEFLRLMIRHHQGGKEMAVYAAEHADVPAVRRLAGTIVDTQAAEVTTMADMLKSRGGTPLPAP